MENRTEICATNIEFSNIIHVVLHNVVCIIIKNLNLIYIHITLLVVDIRLFQLFGNVLLSEINDKLNINFNILNPTISWNHVALIICILLYCNNI